MNQLTIPAAAKAYLAAAGSAIAYLLGVLDPSVIGWSAFANVTMTQWLGGLLAVLGSFGITWVVPNREV